MSFPIFPKLHLCSQDVGSIFTNMFTEIIIQEITQNDTDLFIPIIFVTYVYVDRMLISTVGIQTRHNGRHKRFITSI